MTGLHQIAEIRLLCVPQKAEEIYSNSDYWVGEAIAQNARNHFVVLSPNSLSLC